MVTPPVATHQAPRIQLSRIVIAGLISIVAASLANTVVRFITVLMFSIDPSFGPLQLMTPIVFTTIGVLCGVLVFAVLSRTVQQPVRVFRIIALVVLLVSFIPDILLFFADPAQIPGLSVPGIVALIIMHIVAWAITVNVLSRLQHA